MIFIWSKLDVEVECLKFLILELYFYHVMSTCVTAPLHLCVSFDSWIDEYKYYLNISFDLKPNKMNQDQENKPKAAFNIDIASDYFDSGG